MKVVGKIFAVLFCIVYFFLLTGLLIASFSLNILSPKYYTQILKNVDFKSISVSEFGDLFDGANLEEDATVEDVAVKYLTAGGSVSEEVALAVINNDLIKEVVGDFIGSVMNYTVTGERPTIDKKKFNAIFEQPEVKELLDSTPDKINVTKKEIDELYDELNVLIDELVEGGGNNGGDTIRNKQYFEVN